ncbi:hypothetical protein R3P38DRAFT_1119861 [Favolaschia claudopus]|uniref:Transmembrane protein n=1 Tax=Favolaschia claudopus TaxID=2862362 RepID=A0AAW0B939_9AGAR
MMLERLTTMSMDYRVRGTNPRCLSSSLRHLPSATDHLKDFVVLFLLILYLHQLIEAPWSLYRSARPRRSLIPTASTPPSAASALHIAAAKSQLRSLEFFLLTLCVLTPVLGVLLLCLLASFTSSSPTSNAAAATTPISRFSTTLFGLITAIRPLRELVCRLSTRTTRFTLPPPPLPLLTATPQQRQRKTK